MAQNDFCISRHARTRMCQRGVTADFLKTLIHHADCETHVGGGGMALRVSRRRAEILNLGDRLHRLAVVVSNDGTLITITRMSNGALGRRYRRK